MSDEEFVKQKYPNAETNTGFMTAVFNGSKMLSTFHVNPLDAWADAAAKLREEPSIPKFVKAGGIFAEVRASKVAAVMSPVCEHGVGWPGDCEQCLSEPCHGECKVCGSTWTTKEPVIACPVCPVLREEPSKPTGGMATGEAADRQGCTHGFWQCIDCGFEQRGHPKPSLSPEMAQLRALVNEQAEDEGLWFRAVYVSEAYLQQALRLIHDRAEKLLDALEGKS